MEPNQTGSLRSLFKSKLFSPSSTTTPIHSNPSNPLPSTHPPKLDFDRDLVIINHHQISHHPKSISKSPQPIIQVQVPKPRLKLNNQLRRPSSSNGIGPKIFKLDHQLYSNPNLNQHQLNPTSIFVNSNHHDHEVLNIVKPTQSIVPPSRQLPPAHGSIFIRPTPLPQINSHHLIITPNTPIHTTFTQSISPNDKSYPTLPLTSNNPDLMKTHPSTDLKQKPVRQNSIRRQTIASSSGLNSTIPAFDLTLINQSTPPIETSPQSITKPRSNSVDLAEARKIILGLQSQVDDFKQNQHIPPSPPPSNSNQLNQPFEPIRPISPPHSTSPKPKLNSNQTIVIPSSPSNGSDSSLPELQPSLCSLLSPNSLYSSSSRPSTAPSSIFEPKTSTSSSRLGSSTSTQSSSASMTTALTASFKCSMKSERHRTRNTSLFSATSHDLQAIRDINVSACHELVEQLSTGSSPTTLIGSSSELVEQGVGKHRSQPSQTSEVSRTSCDRFDTPEPSPTWATTLPTTTPTPTSTTTHHFPEQIFRPGLTVKPLRSQAGKRWQNQSPTDPSFPRHEPKRSISYAILQSPFSSVTTRTLPSRMRHDRSDSGASALQSLFPGGSATIRPGSRATSVTSAKRPESGMSHYPHHQQQHDRTGSVISDPPYYRPGSGSSETHHRPGSGMSGGLVSPRPGSGLSSRAGKEKIKYEFLDRSQGSTSPRMTVESKRYSRTEQLSDRFNQSNNITTPSLTLAEARQMSKLELFLLASRHAGELERCSIEKRALLEALRESENEIKKIQIKLESIEVENARLETRANGMANELKRAVVDLRSASRIPRRKLSSTTSNLMMNRIKDEWIQQTHEDEGEGSGGSETETEDQPIEEDDHESKSSQDKDDSAEESEADDLFRSIHHRISLSNSSISGTVETEWRLKPEDELFLQDLDDLDFGDEGPEDDES